MPREMIDMVQLCKECGVEVGTISEKKENMMLATIDQVWCEPCQAVMPASRDVAGTPHRNRDERPRPTQGCCRRRLTRGEPRINACSTGAGVLSSARIAREGGGCHDAQRSVPAPAHGVLGRALGPPHTSRLQHPAPQNRRCDVDRDGEHGQVPDLPHLVAHRPVEQAQEAEEAAVDPFSATDINRPTYR